MEGSVSEREREGICDRYALRSKIRSTAAFSSARVAQETERSARR
jgi:hypothetical protein